jgi:large subunit ribosomal protein L18
MGNVYKLSRIRKGKTNYRKRERLLLGKTTFMSVKVSTQNVYAQVLRPELEGDKVITSVHSRELTSFGWNGSLKNMSACYLVGFLLGRKCKEKGIKHVVLYTGIRPFTTRIASCVKGLIEAGVTSPHSPEILPPEDRITGAHIAAYANVLKGKEDQYKSRFSGLLSRGMKPETYPDHFGTVKNQIMQTNLEDLGKDSRHSIPA